MTPDQAERLVRAVESISSNVGCLTLVMVLMLLFKNMCGERRDR